MKEATKYEIKECSSIISSYLENIPAYICRDRKGKATALLALAYKISQNKEKEGDGIDYGKLGLGAAAAVTIGAIFPPSLGIIGGGLIGRGLIGVLGATVGKLIKDSSVENPSENAIQKLSRDKWDYLTTYSEASLNAIADRITDTLYPKRLNDVDIRMLLSLADVSPFDAIETINCDLGIIYEIESLTDNTCISDDSCSSEIEKAITGLTQKPGRRSGSKVKFLMTERLKLDDNTYALNTQAINYMAEMCGMVSQLEPGQTLIATAPRHFLYSPGFQKIRKALFANGHLKAIMPLKQPVIYGGMDFVAMVFTGDVSKKLLVFTSKWNQALPEASDKRISNYQLQAALRTHLANKGNTRDMYYISCTSLRPPYIIDPSFRSREKTVKLGDVASVGQPCKRAYSEVSGFELSIANLSKQEPLKPIEWRSLEVETTAHPTKWFHITTDNVVLLCILNGVIFTGYMEDVKEENFFLVGPVSSDRIIVLGLNNESGINPRYLAQTLQSDKCAVCKQLLAADYYAASSGLIYSILHTYIPNLSEAAQNKDVAETASRQLEQSDREWKQKFDEYENAVRERKHALSQEFLRMHAASKRLTKYCRNHDGKFDLKADIGRGSTVEDVIGRLESSIPEIGELINNIASTDTSLGQPETLNVIEELRHCSTKWPDGIKVEEEDFACTPQIPDNTFIEFPRELLHRIFFNIYDNAERHGFPENEAKKIIRIRWNLVGDMIEIRIANNGRPLRKTPYGYFTKAHRKSYQHKDGHRSEGIGNLQSKRYMEAFGGTVSLDKIDEGEFKVAYTLRFKLKHQ